MANRYFNTSGVSFGGTDLLGGRRLGITPQASVQTLPDDHEVGINDVLITDLYYTLEVDVTDMNVLKASAPGTTGAFAATIHGKSIGTSNLTVSVAAGNCFLLPNKNLNVGHAQMGGNVLRFGVTGNALSIS